MKVETMLEIVKKSTTDTAKICKTTFNAPSQTRTQANATSNAELNLSISNRNFEEPNTPEVILQTCVYIAGSQSRGSKTGESVTVMVQLFMIRIFTISHDLIS